MTIENKVKDVIAQKLQEGIVEKLVAENLEKSINKALENLTGTFGDVTKVIERKIKEVMVEQLSSYDYSRYIVKLDCVLTEILQKTALDHKKILENFKELMVKGDIPKVVKVSDIFEQFKKYAAKEVDTGELEVNTDDTPCYGYLNVTMEVEYEEKRSWSNSDFKHAKIIFECKEDEELNCEVRISKFASYAWHLNDKIDSSICSLRHLDSFKLYLLKLYQNNVDIQIDEDYLEDDEVEVEAEPEASFS